MPVVSVCVPTYNGSKYLESCLDSILSQTFTDFEVVIVDDQSSDTTCDSAMAYAARDKRIKVFRNPVNLGLVGNWNRCVELAGGEWIKYVFQDDLLEPACLEKMMAVARPEVGMVVCRRDFIFEGVSDAVCKVFLHCVERYDIEKLLPAKTEISSTDFRRLVAQTFCNNFVGEPTSVLLHRTVFYRFGMFNPYLIQLCDIEFWTRVGINNGMTYVPERLSRFRVHGNSTTERNRSTRKNQINLLDEMLMLMDFAFHPVYALLREEAARQDPPVDFCALLAAKICETRKLAKELATRASQPDTMLLRDFEVLKNKYPILGRIRKIPLSRTFSHVYRKVSEKMRVFGCTT
jgi:glycosyltransferase involved in cell wall biosynthesis